MKSHSNSINCDAESFKISEDTRDTHDKTVSDETDDKNRFDGESPRKGDAEA